MLYGSEHRFVGFKRLCAPTRTVLQAVNSERLLGHCRLVAVLANAGGLGQLRNESVQGVLEAFLSPFASCDVGIDGLADRIESALARGEELTFDFEFTDADRLKGDQHVAAR